MEDTRFLSLQNIYKSFGSNIVLKNFSYDFECKGIISVMGESGCGKTTLLRIIAGLEKIDSGSIIKKENLTVSYVFQEPRLFPGFSALDNVACCCGKSDAEHLLGEVGLGDYKNHFPRELSGGMQQRVAIARALGAKSDVLLLDEAFRSQDEKTRLTLHKIIMDYAKNNLIIAVTHDSDEAEKLSNGIILLNKH